MFTFSVFIFNYSLKNKFLTHALSSNSFGIWPWSYYPSLTALWDEEILSWHLQEVKCRVLRDTS